MSKNLLHKRKLADFQAWLTAKGKEWRPGKGEWQLMQVAFTPKNGTKQWSVVYERLDMPEHVTTDRRMDNLVRQFIKESSSACRS